MKSILFPRYLLDSAEIPQAAGLSPAQKYLLAMCCLHANAAGVVYLSATVCAAWGVVHSVARQLACELTVRGLAVFDEATNELFVMHWFHWQKSPTAGGKWADQVHIAVRGVRSAVIPDAIQEAISMAPAKRMETVLVPSNLISSLRHPSPGKRWEAAPALLLLTLYTWPTMNWSGVMVVDYDATAVYVGASGPLQIIGHLRDLDRAGNLVFDEVTGEVFLPARLKNADPDRHLDDIRAARCDFVSHRVKTNFSRLFSRTFEKNHLKTKTSTPVDLEFTCSVSRNCSSPPALPEGNMLQSESHPETAMLLNEIVRSARLRNKKSDVRLDEGHAADGLDFATQNLSDAVAAAALKALAAGGGWPREVGACLKAALVQLTRAASRAKASPVEDKKIDGKAEVPPGGNLVGKMLRTQAGDVFTVSRLITEVPRGGRKLFLADIAKMVEDGRATVVTDDDNQKEAA